MNEIAQILYRKSIHCETYHADLPIELSSKILDDFHNEVVKVVVATIAFGMEIDKPDIRTIIHYGAGRDDSRSEAITFHSKEDFKLHNWFIAENKSPSNEYRSHLNKIRFEMIKFCITALIVEGKLSNY